MPLSVNHTHWSKLRERNRHNRKSSCRRYNHKTEVNVTPVHVNHIKSHADHPFRYSGNKKMTSCCKIFLQATERPVRRKVFTFSSSCFLTSCSFQNRQKKPQVKTCELFIVKGAKIPENTFAHFLCGDGLIVVINSSS